MTEKEIKKIETGDKKVLSADMTDAEMKTFATDMTSVIQALLGVMDGFEDIVESLNRPGERIRKNGPGIRRYGFIDKTSDLAAANPQFAPALFSATDLKDLVRDIELVRNLLNYLQQYSRMSQDCLLILGDRAYSMALLYYQSVRQLAQRNAPGAEAVFRALEPFFRRRNPEAPEEPPTEARVLRDVKAALHGRKDAKIVIENEKPHLVGGKHVVVDETFRDREGFKATEEL